MTEGTVEQSGTGHGYIMYQVQEWCNDGDLFGFITGQIEGKRTMHENMARALFRQIASGVQFMHNRGMYHRDLKAKAPLYKISIHRL